MCKARVIHVDFSTPEFLYLMVKKRHNPGVEFQKQEQTGISPGNTRQTKRSHKKLLDGEIEG